MFMGAIGFNVTLHIVPLSSSGEWLSVLGSNFFLKDNKILMITSSHFNVDFYA